MRFANTWPSKGFKLRVSALDYLCCPSTKLPFKLLDPIYSDSGDDVISGRLVCEESGADYPIIDGVPVILDEVGAMSVTEQAFGNQWKLHARGYFEKDKIFGRDHQTCLHHFKDYFNIEPGQPMESKVFLDAGCGLAPYAIAFARSFPDATAFAIDMSESVMHVDASDLPNLHLVRCDLRNPPFREKFADIGWSYGVLHHTPSTQDAFNALESFISAGGLLYIWVYSQHNTKPSFICRSLLPFSYKYPRLLNYILSYLLAVPFFLVYRTHFLIRSLNPNIRPLLKKHEYVNIATGIHDSLVPEFQHYQTRDEVMGWYDKAGFNEIRLVGDIGVVGKKLN